MGPRDIGRWLMVVGVVTFFGVGMYFASADEEGSTSESNLAIGAAVVFVAGLILWSMAPYMQQRSPTSSTAEELERLAALHRSGALTAEEYEAAKRRALGE